MMTTYQLIEDLPKLVEPIPDDGIISRTIHKESHLKVVVFGFGQGQSLSEHTAAQTAVIHILKGSATLTLNGDTRELHEGSWVHMPPHLKHSVVANSPLVMLLLLLDQS